MNFGLALEIDSEFDYLSPVIAELGADLKRYFEGKDYGPDVSNMFVGVVLMDADAERLHPTTPVRYTKSRKINIPGGPTELNNVIEYHVKPSLDEIRHADSIVVRRTISRLLVDSVDALERSRSKFPDFDVARFRRDLAGFS